MRSFPPVFVHPPERSARRWAILSFAALLVACAAPDRRLEYGEVQSAILDKGMGFAVLRAPVAPGVDPSELPVVVLLHGMGDDHRSLDRFGLSSRRGIQSSDGHVIG